MTDLYQAIADHLRPLCSSAADAVAATSVQDFTSMALGPVPTIGVVPAGERWNPVRESGLQVSAQGRVAFSCIVGLTFPATLANWSGVRAEIRAALLGWTPDAPEVAGPVEASGGRLLVYAPEDGGRWLHAFDFNLPVQATYGIQ